MTRRAARVFKAFEAAADDDEDDDGQMGPLAPAAVDGKDLIADDFELNKRIGDETLQQRVEGEIENIIGMEAAKAWFSELNKKVRMP